MIDDKVEVWEEWTPYKHTIKVDGKVIRDESNIYPYNPMASQDVNLRDFKG